MGISALFGFVAALGFLGLLAGLGLIVVAISQGRNARGGVSLAVIGGVVGVLFYIISNGVIIVQRTEVAVVFNVLSGSLEEPPRGPGTHIIIPLLQEAHIYPTAQQEYTVSGVPNEGAVGGNDAVRARSADGQEVFLDVTVLYRIDVAEANRVHNTWQNRYQDDFVRPTLRSLSRDAVSQFRAEDLFGGRRDELQQAIFVPMQERLASDGFILSDLLIRDITFREEFAASIENKQIAEQNRLRQEQESERVRIQAAGERDAEIARAEGEAQAIVLRAQANAEALRVVSEQIAANPSLIQYLYVTTLSDNVELALVPANSPFLFDFSSLAQANPNFTAPAVPDTTLPSADSSTSDDASGGSS